MNIDLVQQKNATEKYIKARLLKKEASTRRKEVPGGCDRRLNSEKKN